MNVGLIGCGRMGQALTLGAIRSGALEASRLFLYDPVPAAVEAIQAEAAAAQACESLNALIETCDALLICVKPGDVAEVLQEVALSGRSHQDLLALSIAAGVTIPQMEAASSGHARIIRIMPNTPSLVGKGTAAYSLGTSATQEDASFAETLLGSVGIVQQVEESLMDAVTGLSGSGPAYVYRFIEALTEGGVQEGLSRDQALALATQTVLGAAQMVRDTGLAPAELRDRVCSPGGTTFVGLAALEEGHFYPTVISAVHSATARSKEMAQQ